MLKFNRNYKLFLDDINLLPVDITMPFTLEFDVLRNTNSSANVAHLRIMNLNTNTRRRLLKNPNIAQNRKMQLVAGYGNVMNVILYSQIKQCFSHREGVNFVTEIQSFDGGWAYNNAIIDEKEFVFPAGTTHKQVITAMINSLSSYDVAFGHVGDFPTVLKKRTPFTGGTINNLKELTNQNFFIDNGIAYALGVGETLLTQNTISEINAQTGLIGTPIREERFLRCEVVFEPRFKMKQKIKLTSSTLTEEFNGIYEIVEIHHKGTISATEAGTATTQVGLLGAEPKTVQALAITN